MKHGADPERAAPEPSGDFAARAEGPSQGIVREFLAFLRHNKKWWLLPLVVVLLLLGLLVLVGGSALAPFLYPLF